MKNANQMYSLKERIRKRRRWYHTVSVTLAAIVVFCTVYALILPAITLEKAGVSNSVDWGYNEDGSIYWTVDGQRQEAQRLASASAPGTVLNLFDYWIAEDRYASDYHGDIIRPDQLLSGGINNGHAFKFSDGNGIMAKTGNESPLNEWVGGGINPLQGIVENRLSSNGYPVLSGRYPVDGYGYDAQESLEYLFNPSLEHEGKASYRNVRGLLGIDGDGYYSFDCKKQMAEFNEADNSFRIYDRPCASEGFFPFNQAPQIMNAARDGYKVNHYFGITITTRFIQLNGGHVSPDRKVDTVFEFTGDDDVWIFVDDVLVGDVGGIHDPSTVSINFATGEVSVYVNANPDGAIRTTLYDCYTAAGKQDVMHWQETADGGKTFTDDSTHTLKFFYLERGNYDSNLKLKYNLTEIPASGISKVDQYGDAVPGATFTAYAANENYEMLEQKDGDPVTITGEYGKDWSYAENGDILDSGGNVLVHALYTGTTGVDGMMVFTTPEGKLYAIEGLETLLGQYFIIRETKRPEGYRIVYTDAHLQIWTGENQKIIRCNNTSQSGVRASTNLQITATMQLYLRRPYNGSYIVNYHPDGNTPAQGTLFAVPFMYTGELDAEGNPLNSNDETAWTPVYGNDRTGYRLVPRSYGGATPGLAAALKAAKMAAETNGINDVVFRLSLNGTMQLTMRNLPGHITDYYRLLARQDKGKAKFSVAYYWTDQNNLDQATPENTYRVYTFSEAVEDGISFSDFERKFGATIRVPNLINRVFVQKMNEKNERIDGATFAIYRVQQDKETNAISYLAQDGSYIPLPENVSVGSDGVITVGGKKIVPLKTSVTRTYADGIHTGTAEFTNLSDGQYIVKEVNPPPGYRINTTDVMVLVTEDTVYANAGTADDGVTVGRGPGYLVDTLDQFASLGQINVTMAWIYTRMLITSPSTSFYDIENEDLVIGYLKKNNSCETTDQLEEAFKTYLVYSEDNIGTVFNYVPNPDRNTGADSDGWRRIFTTVGWNYYAMLQDYEYGSEKAKEIGAQYADWSGQNLMNLFSRSTYIRITDDWETTLQVYKADAQNPNIGLLGASFRLYTLQRKDDGTQEKLYYAVDSVTKKAEWTTVAANALTVSTGENGMGAVSFAGLKEGTYYLEETKAPNGYYKLKEPVKLVLEETKLTVDAGPSGEKQSAKVDGGVLDEDNLYIYTVTVYNASGYELPATGGSGTAPYKTVGILLMLLPFVYAYGKKRRSERRTM